MEEFDKLKTISKEIQRWVNDIENLTRNIRELDIEDMLWVNTISDTTIVALPREMQRELILRYEKERDESWEKGMKKWGHLIEG